MSSSSDKASSSLTDQLLTHPEIADHYRRATQTDFLRLAGEGRLPRDQLSQWLSQDRLYAQAYARFIGGLISRVQLPSRSTLVDDLAAGNVNVDTTKTVQWKILVMLQNCLAGITVELPFFEKSAREYELDLTATGAGDEQKGFGPNKTTREYIELFDSFTAQPVGRTDRSLLDGLVILWATEKVYLDAWTYAKQQRQSSSSSSQQGGGSEEDDFDGGALRKAFIPNWTSDEFRRFVEDIGECLDTYAAYLSEETEEVRASSAMTLFRQVLVLEEDFWPVVDEM